MNKFIVTIAVIGSMCAFAITDAILLAPELPIIASISNRFIAQTPTDPTIEPSTEPTTEPNTGEQIVTKQESINLNDAAIAANIELFDTDESFFVSSIVTDSTVNTKSLVAQNDRVGSIAWVESPQVKTNYQALKGALHGNFTADVTDLQDQTIRQNGSPVRNQLTFYDPGISNDRLVFLRVRDRLYELRLVTGKEELIQPLIDQLSL